MQGMQFVIIPVQHDASTKDAPSSQVQVTAGGHTRSHVVLNKDLSGWFQTQLLQGKITEIRLQTAEGTPEPRYTEASAEKSRTAAG
jgi:hypothetical protein